MSTNESKVNITSGRESLGDEQRERERQRTFLAINRMATRTLKSKKQQQSRVFPFDQIQMSTLTWKREKELRARNKKQ